MLCTLKVRRSPDLAEDAIPYGLKITSKHAVGGAGGLLSDEVKYATLPDLLQALRSLDVSGEILETTQMTLDLERADDRWLPVGTDLQIPFAVLAAAEFDLAEEE